MLRQGIVIGSKTQIDALLDRGVYFILDEEDASRPIDPGPQESGLSCFDLIDEAYRRLESLYGSSALCSDPAQKNLQSTVERLCKIIQSACDEDRDASLSTILLQPEGRYSVNHQVQTAVACEIILRNIGYSKDERLSVVGAGLTMNIAIGELQDELFFQSEKLSREQQEKIEAHLFEGVELLGRCGIEDKLWMDTVLQHHEFLDGSGYPRKLEGDAIREPSRILTIADIFCAKVTGRAYRRPIAANRALREIYCKERGHSIDTALLHVFIKELGIYPPGSLVRLANGEIAVVIRCGPRVDCPIVRSIIKPTSEAYLNPRFRDTGRKEFAIVEVSTSRELRACINRYKLWAPESD